MADSSGFAGIFGMHVVCSTVFEKNKVEFTIRGTLC